MKSKKILRRDRIRHRVRKKISGTTDRPRLSVFRSNKDIYAQLIDDSKGHTLISCSSRDKALVSEKGTKIEIAKKVGAALGQMAGEKGINTVVFDRGGYLYHGRVKALADGAREAGVKF